MHYIDYSYINQLSGQLDKFKWKSNKMAICRCPICGDSQKNKFKTRFYFIEDNAHFRVYCHNCHYSSAFGHFLNKFNHELYDEYRKEIFAEKMKIGYHKVIPKPESLIKNPEFKFDAFPLNVLSRISGLSHTHEAVRYLKDRAIPEDKFDRLYYTDNFQEWVNSYIPQKYEHVSDTDPRIVMPFIKDNIFFACSGRTIVDSPKRYFQISIDYEKKYPHLFGIDRVDISKDFYVVEGGMDSLMLDNAIAMGTNAIDLNGFDYKNGIFCLDNEPRNSDVAKQMNKIIAAGYKIVIWPVGLLQKDLNQMKIDGIDYKNIIAKNIYSGLGATNKLYEWKKVSL